MSELMHCLVTSRNDREQCVEFENMLSQCNQRIYQMKGVPKATNYCVDEIFDYSKCSVHLNTSMCVNEYKMLHECKLRRRRYLFGEDLGLIKMNPQARKKW